MDGRAAEEQEVDGGEERRMQAQKAPFTEEHSHLLSTAFIATAGCVLLGEGREPMWNQLEGGTHVMPVGLASEGGVLAAWLWEAVQEALEAGGGTPRGAPCSPPACKMSQL